MEPKITRPRGISWTTAAQLLVAVLLGAAGIAHLYLAPEHLAESTLVGVGFIAAGIVQLALAALVLLRPDRGVLWAVIAVSAVLIIFYAWNVLLGLPIVGPDAAQHAHEGGLVIGLGERIDAAGALTKAAELLTIVGAALLLRGANSAGK